MTAVATWGSLPSSPVGSPATQAGACPGRAHLWLVPSGPAERAGTPGREAAGPRVRVTRRGRLARAALLAVLVLTACWSVTGMLQARAAAPGVPAVGEGQPVVQVLACQTLSEIALTQLPGLPVREGVARIQLANDLNTDQVHAGQRLRIPAGIPAG